MTIEMKFDYERLCKVQFVRGVQDVEDCVLDLLQRVLDNSLKYSKTNRFAKKFTKKADTAETQVKMYADLAGYVYDNVQKEWTEELLVHNTGADMKEIDEHAAILTDKVLRPAFIQLACFDEGIAINGHSLLEAYIRERYDISGKAKPTEIRTKEYASDFVDMFNIPERDPVRNDKYIKSVLSKIS